jgi:2-keto-4-pentenoate hydratase/2-oxohepta-3-ene-1,7-dioic acid hydratase in catechol pathway
MIRNIWAVGRNYAEHAKELGNAVPSKDSSTPLFFLKAGSCATFSQKEMNLPEGTNELHHEVELCLQFDDKLEIKKACLAIDLTDRAKQNTLKAAGHPWTLAKSFKEACPLSDFFPVTNLADLQNVELRLSVNGELRQSGSTKDMIFNIPTLIAYTLKNFPVEPGDLLLTGTPSGVGPLKKGDQVSAEIVGKVAHSWVVK